VNFRPRTVDHGCAVQDAGRTRSAREIAVPFHTPQPERGYAELVMRVPGRHVVTDIAHMCKSGLSLRSVMADGNHARAVVVHDP